MAGRSKAFVPGPRVSCAYDLCLNPAMARVNSANLCRVHYDFQAERDAELFCDAQGLITVEDKREWCRKHMKTFGRTGFHEWAARLTQKDVDLLARLGLARTLEKLRDRGVINADGRIA